MNEQANKILIELLQKAVRGIDGAVSFSQAQIPDVIHQLLVWNAVTTLIVQIVSIVFIGVYIWLGIKSIRILFEDCRYDGSEIMAMIWLIVGGISSFVFIVAFFNSFDWLKIWLAPKLYLLEYAASLIK